MSEMRLFATTALIVLILNYALETIRIMLLTVGHSYQ